jgi:hypothetical protein
VRPNPVHTLTGWALLPGVLPRSCVLPWSLACGPRLSVHERVLASSFAAREFLPVGPWHQGFFNLSAPKQPCGSRGFGAAQTNLGAPRSYKIRPDPLPSVELTTDFESSLPDCHGPPRREIGRRRRPAFSLTGEPSVSCPGASPGLVDDVYGFDVEGLETKGP